MNNTAGFLGLRQLQSLELGRDQFLGPWILEKLISASVRNVVLKSNTVQKP